MSIFDKRVNLKPYEYPGVQMFIDSLNKVFWVHGEVDFTSDVQDFNTALTPVEQEIYLRNFLAIAQIEVAVKTFWGTLYNYFPKPEFNALGITNAETEVRHEAAYSRGLTLFGLEDRFKDLLEVPAFKRKLDLIDKYMADPNIRIETKLLFFSLVIENSALFGQFAIGVGFTRHRGGVMKNMTNIISWTAIDELIHAQSGMFILNIIKDERGQIFDDIDIEEVVKMYVEVEKGVIEWIFHGNKLSFIDEETLVNYIRHRVDESLVQLGFNKVFNVPQYEVDKMFWFEEEIHSSALDDFFAKRPVDYTKHDKSITSDDLF